jgi:hypothetical protein
MAMACAARGTTRSVSWTSGAAPLVPQFAPLFGVNDNGDAEYRAVHAAARRLWAANGAHAPLVAASRAQTAFWQGQMAACRWWHSVSRMVDRALIAGETAMQFPAMAAALPPACHAPVNS